MMCGISRPWRLISVWTLLTFLIWFTNRKDSQKSFNTSNGSLNDRQGQNRNHIRKQDLNLTFHGPDEPPMHLYRAYHDILFEALRDHKEEYKVVSPDDHSERKSRVRRLCRSLGANPVTTMKSMWYLEAHNTLYCPAAKSGSTFWRKVWNRMVLDDPKLPSPYQFSFGDFNQLDSNDVVRYDYQKYLNHSFKFLFVRDPYHRIFSTYVEKVFAPNIFMWDLGKYVATYELPNSSEKSRRCGHDITFEQFIGHILSLPTTNLDEHYQPISMMCDVCRVKYDIIGKVESFKYDAMYILNHTGMWDNKVHIKDFRLEGVVDSIVSLVARVFHQRERLKSCITFHKTLQRMWRQFQITGFLSKREIFPLTPAQSETSTRVQIINMVLEAYKRSGKDAQLNKKEAFILAYKQVRFDYLELLSEKFYADFLLFEYDDKPKEIFQNRNRKHVGFDYFDLLKD